MKNTETTLAYIAGLIDGEGYIGVKRSGAYECQGRKTPGYHARIQIRMVHEGAIKLLADTLGGWYYKEKAHLAKGRPLFCYQASDASAETVIQKVLPYLVVKKESAESVLRLRSLQAEGHKHRTKITGYRNFPNSHGTARQVANKSFSDEFVSACDVIYLRCKELNRVGI
jgi:hypothetical protein